MHAAAHLLEAARSAKRCPLRPHLLQEKKKLLFESTVGQDNAALARLTEDDLRFLFA